MKYTILYSIILLFLLSNLSLVSAQEIKQKKLPKKHKFTLYAGVGPNYYFNNLIMSKDQVRELNYGFVTRIMWEPEYFLSLGFETGYNRLYSIKESLGNNSQIRINNSAIPLQIVISMKFLQHFYGNFLMGQSFLLNNIKSTKNGVPNNMNATTFSPGDFGLTVGYKKSINPRIFIGTELKGFYSTKLDDKNIGLMIMAGYRL